MEPMLPDLQIPIQLLWGERDTWLLPDKAKKAHQSIPNSELEFIKDAGHFSPEDNPDEIYEKQYFTVNITNKTGDPVEAWVLFTFPLHLPMLKYGSSINFRSPIIFGILKKSLQGKIRVFKKFSLSNILRNKYDSEKVIILINGY